MGVGWRENHQNSHLEKPKEKNHELDKPHFRINPELQFY